MLSVDASGLLPVSFVRKLTLFFLFLTRSVRLITGPHFAIHDSWTVYRLIFGGHFISILVNCLEVAPQFQRVKNYLLLGFCGGTLRRSPFHHSSLNHIRVRIVETIHSLSIFVLVCLSHIEWASDAHWIIFGLPFALTSTSRRMPASISTVGPLLRPISVIHCIEVVTCSNALLSSLTVRSVTERRKPKMWLISLIKRNFVRFKLTF